MLPVTLYLLLIVVTCIFLFCKIKFKYWEKKGVASLNPFTPAGDILLCLIGRRNLHVLLQDCYNKFKRRGLKYGGLYFTLGPTFFPLDPELIKRILQTDYDYFQDRGYYHNKEEQPFSENLVTLEGEDHKIMRAKLSPAFTVCKLKAMLPTVQKYSKQMEEIFKQSAGSAVNCFDLFRRYSLDVVIECFFGIEEHTMLNEHSVYMEISNRISKCSTSDMLKVIWTEGTNNPGSLFKVLFMDEEIYKFFVKVVADIVAYRAENKVQRNDLMDCLLTMMEHDKNTEGNHAINLNEITANVVTFFTAGFETTYTTLSLCIYEIAKHPHIQEKLREEITAALEENNNEITFAMIEEMKYLNQIITETLRLHSVVPTMNRMCVKDYKIPGSDVVIEKGTPVLISILGTHQDPEIFPNPEKFDPSRFGTNDRIISSLGFGGGPKICIGKRFAEMVLKVPIIKILSNFKLTVDEKTGPCLQIDNMTQHLILQYKNSIWVNFEQLD